MDRHFLTSLFNPRSVIAFAGDPDGEAPSREARVLRTALAEGGDLGSYQGELTWLDIHTTGTLAQGLLIGLIWLTRRPAQGGAGSADAAGAH